MSYLIELSNQSKKPSRFLFCYHNECLIYEDKLGLIDINFPPSEKQTAKVLYHLKFESDTEFSVKDAQGNCQTYRNYAELNTEDQHITIFQISAQAELLNKSANIDAIETDKKFLLTCPQLNLNLQVLPDSKISLGSSEFDSIVLMQKGIRPRHLEIRIGQNLQDCEFKACLGQIIQSDQDDVKKFSISTTESGVLEFNLSKAGHSPGTAQI